jgi:hypothetical protein
VAARGSPEAPTVTAQLKRKSRSPDQTSPAKRRSRTATGSAAGPPTHVSPRAARPARAQPQTPTTHPCRHRTQTPPSPLAASHRHLKPQLAQPFIRLYGTTQHRGIMASMPILRLYCQCLGATWNSRSSRDPVVFFRTSDMADASKWPPLPPGFDRRLPKAFAFTPRTRAQSDL